AVIEMNPNFVLAYVGLALSRMGKDDLEQARETWRKLEKIGPDGASAAATGLADMDLYQGRAADAIAILENAVADDEQNKNPDAAAVKWTTLAQAYLLLDRPGPARTALPHALADSKDTSVVFESSRLAERLVEDDSELEACLKRRGESTAAFLDEQPTYRLFPPLYYYIGRAQEGLKSPAANESYKTFLALRQNADRDPLVTDARRRSAN